MKLESTALHWLAPALCAAAGSLASWWSTVGGAQDASRAGTAAVQPSAAQAQWVEGLRAEGIHFDPAAGLVAIPVTVEILDDLLEYFLVGPAGARHETVFSTPVRPSVLNAALLTLGVEPGRNASWTKKEPAPTPEELRAGAQPYDISLPAGDGLYLYAGWRRGEETFFYRAEDLVRDLATGQAMRRHRWIYLGSRMLTPRPGGPGSSGSADSAPVQEEFAADIYQNLINIAFFSDGYTLCTAALPECLEQTIWMSNAWLLPERGQGALLVFSRTPLERLPASAAALLPDLGPSPSPYELAARAAAAAPR